MSEEMDSMLDMYLYENGQLLEKLEMTTLEKKDADCFDEADINEFFRVMHTIKGSSGIMMFDNIMKLAHKLEDVFFYIRESHPDNVPHLELVDKIFAVADFFREEFENISEGGEPTKDSTELIEDIDKFLSKIKNEIVSEHKPLPKQEKDEGPTHFYIAPAVTEDAKYFHIQVYWSNDTQMANMHAFALANALKDSVEDMYYTPDDIITNEDSADVVLEQGFRMLVKTHNDKAAIEAILGTHVVQSMEVTESSKAEYEMGFDIPAPIMGAATIDLGDEPKEEEKKKDEVTPGDYVIDAKPAGKKMTLAKDKKPKAPPQSYISVNVGKIDQLMDLIGEIVISESVVLQNPDLNVPGLNLSNFNKSAAQLTKFTAEMQDVIMSMRMMPLTNTFQKMNRIVFDTSRKLGKDIELKMIGEDTEVDKNIIEKISDPLMHMIRNSIDHGIEDKEARVAAGKPEKGLITLEAKNEGGKVVISVTDDGGGMNPEKLFAKAKKNGIIPAEKTINDYTKKEIYQFITYPGFSTNEQVTELSGRGVGMDVVVKNLQSVGGMLEIDSEFGKGSTMALKIPLTLAIISGILLQVGDAKFAIETSVVKEFINMRQSSTLTDPDGREYLNVRGQHYMVVRLSDKYHIEGAKEKIEEGIMILTEYESQRICIFVDKLLGGQEIVVKPIPKYIKKVEGLSGCTQLGDGSIALILDIATLV
ncbi:MAG: chemotaxis protein CheA [Pseudobutyrivibrio sp.]|nr:chemotaxis protein CheA [Pseudobutyrivibrio sp.]